MSWQAVEWVLEECGDVTTQEASVLIAICAYIPIGKDQAAAFQADLTRRTKASESTVRRALASLIKKQKIEVVQKGGRAASGRPYPSVYRVCGIPKTGFSTGHSDRSREFSTGQADGSREFSTGQSEFSTGQSDRYATGQSDRYLPITNNSQYCAEPVSNSEMRPFRSRREAENVTGIEASGTAPVVAPSRPRGPRQVPDDVAETIRGLTRRATGTRS